MLSMALSLFGKLNKKNLGFILLIVVLLSALGYLLYLKKSLEAKSLKVKIAEKEIAQLEVDHSILKNRLFLERKLAKEYEQEKERLADKYTQVLNEFDQLELTHKKLMADFKKERDHYAKIKNNLNSPDFYVSFMCKHGYVAKAQCPKEQADQ